MIEPVGQIEKADRQPPAARGGGPVAGKTAEGREVNQSLVNSLK